MTGLFWLTALASAPAVSSIPATSPPTMSIQQQFDTASAAAATLDCVKAVPLFTALERDPRLKEGTLSQAAVAVRKGICLIRQGQNAEGEAAIAKGLPRIERAGANFAVDYTDGENALGDAALSRWDYENAKRHFKAGMAKQEGIGRLSSLGRLARASAFDGGTASLDYVDEGLRYLAADPATSKDLLAQWRTIRARALLNQGRNEDAYNELKTALALSGGLTLKTSVSEASMRGDLALAALLLERKDDARKYMAYTGQGRLANSPFAVAVAMSPPDCGEASGLRPEDFAVVEFAIADDGSVLSPRTIYTRGGPDVAAAFARAVGDWYWRPEDVNKIPGFYRIATRVELRCSAAAGPSQNINKDVFDRLTNWAAKQTGIEVPENGDKQPALAALSRMIAETQAQGPFVRHAAASIQQALGESRYPTRPIASFPAAEASKLPPEVVTAVSYYNRTFAVTERLITPKRVKASDVEAAAAEMLAFAREPAIAADPPVAAAAKFYALRLMPRKEPMGQQSAVLQEIAGDDRLGTAHPLRQLALLDLANRAAAKGDLNAAQAYFQRTGLTEQQCALLGPTPALRRSGAGSEDFPNEAMAYGFEGWVRLEFDIKADGKTAGTRPVIAYPPFVFVDAATRMSSGLRFETSYRPGGNVACSANNSTIRFVMGS